MAQSNRRLHTRLQLPSLPLKKAAEWARDLLDSSADRRDIHVAGLLRRHVRRWDTGCHPRKDIHAVRLPSQSGQSFWKPSGQYRHVLCVLVYHHLLRESAWGELSSRPRSLLSKRYVEQQNSLWLLPRHFEGAWGLDRGLWRPMWLLHEALRVNKPSSKGQPQFGEADSDAVWTTDAGSHRLL